MISIHALCEEGDCRSGEIGVAKNGLISIHALCEEGDMWIWRN